MEFSVKKCQLEPLPVQKPPGIADNVLTSIQNYHDTHFAHDKVTAEHWANERSVIKKTAAVHRTKTTEVAKGLFMNTWKPLG